MAFQTVLKRNEMILIAVLTQSTDGGLQRTDFSVAPLNQIFINFWRDESNEIRVWNR